MRISIGHRLFASVLLAILVVAVAAIALMRQNVMSSFGEYAVSIELDRLDQLSNRLAARYRDQGSWRFIADDEDEPAVWIAAEMARLQHERLGIVAPIVPVAPVPPVAPVAPAPPAPAYASGPGQHAIPELPPLPPPPVPPEPPAVPDPGPVDELGLQDRVTLLDASGAYLAGHRIGKEINASRPITLRGQTIGHLVVARAARPSDAMASAFLAQLKDSLLIIALASIVLSAAAAVLLAAHFRKPILRLADGARQLADGRYDTRLEVARSDELGDLAHSFNQLAAKLDQAEASRRQWVADTSHELRTPLSVLRAQLEAVQDGVRPASAETVASMLRQVLSLNALIDQLYALARADVGELVYQREALDPWALACEQAHAFGQKFAAAGLTLQIGVGAVATVAADAERLRQLFANLLENCIRYCPAGSRVETSARRDDRFVTICVDDSGPGVDDSALARLGERFYRVEGSRSREHGGAGLGLALCRRIAEAHGGTLSAARSPLGGLQMRVRLPLEAA